MVHLGCLIDGLCNLMRALRYDCKKHAKMRFLCPEMSKSYHRSGLVFFGLSIIGNRLWLSSVKIGLKNRTKLDL